MKELYFIYLAILRKAANHVALLQSTAGTSKKQVETCCPVTDSVYLFVYLFIWFFQTTTSSRCGLDSQLRLICFFQEKYVGAICAEVFQKFPDFVQRCKDESFEALSDPVHSGKMKVRFRSKGSVTSLLWAVSEWVNIISVFLFFQVLQKLLKYYLQKGDKVLLFSQSTKVRAVFVWIEI